MKARIFTDGFEGHRKRSKVVVEKLMRSEKIEAETTITFADPLDLVGFLTVERIRLCEVARKKNLSVTELARELRRDRKAVTRDIAKLEQAGFLRTRLESNPGHGNVRIVEPVAQKFELLTTF